MRLEAVASLFADLETIELQTWVERGWVHAEPAETDWEFREIDIARVQLIHDLRRDMELQEDAVPLVLSLLDQLYDVRWALRRLMEAVERQPRELRDAVFAAAREPQK